MNRKYYTGIVLAVALVIIGAGCKSICFNSQRDQPRYALTAKLIEGSSLEFKRIGSNLNWSSTYVNDSDIAAILRSPSVAVVNFPSLTVRVGETKKASNQHYIRYPFTYDKIGNPDKFETRGIGQKIQARLVEAKNSEATVEVFAESVQEPTWITYSRLPEIRQPVFQARSFEPTVTISLNRWFSTGGLVITNNTAVFIMKITKE